MSFSNRGAREAGARVLISLARIRIESLDLAVAQGAYSTQSGQPFHGKLDTRSTPN
jgi:hypothetical protein